MARLLRRGRATAKGHGRWIGTAIDTSHCGAGCALGDLVGEFGLVAFPALATVVGLGTLYGLMAVWQVAVVPSVFGGRASALSPEFWVALQFAMLAGFVCAYPVNAWLVRIGLEEAM